MTPILQVYATERHFVDHCAPIWRALPATMQGGFHVPPQLVAHARSRGVTPTTQRIRLDRPVLIASYGDLKRVRETGARSIAYLEHGSGQCLAPGTRILRADLRYVPVESLQPGDRLVAFDESPLPGRAQREWRTATVTATQRIIRPCYRLTFADGTVVVASEGHLWLTQSAQTYDWSATERLHDAARYPQRSTKAVRLFDVWEEDLTWGGGYLAAAFDGEGHFTQTERPGRQRRIMVGFSQKTNAMSAKVGDLLTDRGFRFSGRLHEQSGVTTTYLKGGTREVLRFVGSVRPRRLLARMKDLDNGAIRGKRVELVKSEFIGEREVIGLETSTGTLIAEGLATHNSYSKAIPNYGGGQSEHHGDIGLYLVPNEANAKRWRGAYPRADVAVVGCPKLDELPTTGQPGVVAISFHWEATIADEARSAFQHHKGVLRDLARRFPIIGHGHPRAIDGEPYLRTAYAAAGIELVEDFEEVCRRASVYVCDNSSTIFEFAATGRPVVLMNAPWYGRGSHHGLRFWDAAHVGLQADHPADLPDAIERALADPPEVAAAREDAVGMVYAHRGDATRRAVGALVAWMRATEARSAA